MSIFGCPAPSVGGSGCSPIINNNVSGGGGGSLACGLVLKCVDPTGDDLYPMGTHWINLDTCDIFILTKLDCPAKWVKITNGTTATMGTLTVLGDTILGDDCTTDTLTIEAVTSVMCDMTIGVTNTDTLTINSNTNITDTTASTSPTTGAVVVAGGVGIGGNLNVGGTISSFDGSLTIGDANTDNVTFNADVNSDFIPDASLTYNLGSAAKKWNELFIGTSKIGDGSAATPSLVFCDDLDTGLYRVGADSFSMTTNGTERVNMDTNNMHILYTDNCISKDTGALVVEGGVGIEKDLCVGGNIDTNDLTVNNNFNLNGLICYSNELMTMTAGNPVQDPDMTKTVSEVTVNNVQATGTLGNGSTVGCIKMITVNSIFGATSKYTLTVATPSLPGGGTTITFNANGQAVTLVWTNAGWSLIYAGAVVS